MSFINNVSQENGNKTTASIHSVNLFPVYTKIKTNVLLRVGSKFRPKNPAQKNLASFFNFFFFKVFKAFYINYINSNSITEHIAL